MTRSTLERLAQDPRYAARRLARDRGFTVAATLILGVGIGACTAMFSIVHAVLLRPFAIRSPERIVMLWSVDSRHQAIGELTYSGRRELGPMRSFEDIALVGSVNWSGTPMIPGTNPVTLSRSDHVCQRRSPARRGDRSRQLSPGATRGGDRSAA